MYFFLYTQLLRGISCAFPAVVYIPYVLFFFNLFISLISSFFFFLFLFFRFFFFFSVFSSFFLPFFSTFFLSSLSISRTSWYLPVSYDFLSRLTKLAALAVTWRCEIGGDFAEWVGETREGVNELAAQMGY